MINLALALVSAITIFVIWKKGIITTLSLVPISIFVTVGITSILFGLFGGGVIRGGGLPALDIGGEIPSIVGIEFLKAAMFLLLGSTFIGILYNFQAPKALSPAEIKSSSPVTSTTITIAIVIIFSISILMLLNSGSYLLSRDTYLIDYGSLSRFYGNLHYMVPILAFVCFWLQKSKSCSSWQKFMLSTLLAFTVIESLASASRALSVIFLSIGLTSVYYSEIFSKIKLVIRITSYSLLTLISYGIVLDLRTLETHGLSPYLDFLGSQDFLSYLGAISIGDIFGNLLSIIPITYLGLSISAPSNYLSISLSPALGETSGWYQIARFMVVNPWTPSGAVAQVSTVSFFTIVLAWFIVGGIIEITARLLSSTSNLREISIITTVITLAASLQFLQYSLRAGMRFIYLQLFFVLLLYLRNKLQISLPGYTKKVITRNPILPNSLL